MPETGPSGEGPDRDDADGLFDPLRLASILSGLVRVVARLALSPEDQREYLRRWGSAGLADPLAQELDDVAHLLDQLEEANWIDPAQAAMVRRIDGLLTTMSGAENAALWRPEALSTAPEWARVRAAAREFLFLRDAFGGV